MSRSLLLVSLVAILGPMSPGQPDFELQGPPCSYSFPVLGFGVCPPALGDPEGVGWNGQGGATVDFFPTCGMSCSGNQYARLRSAGPHSVPPGGPVARPLVASMPACELRIPIPAGASTVSLCWEFFNGEGPAQFFFNDGMSIDVVDCNGNLITPLAYADTFSALGPCSDASLCGNGGMEESTTPGVEIIAAAPLGVMPVGGGWYLSVVVWDGGSTSNQSFGVIDGVSFGMAPPVGCNPVDDGFDIPCCQVVTSTNIPAFPPITLPGTYACLRNCAPEAQLPVNVTLNLSPLLCDYYLLNLGMGAGSPASPSWTPTTLFAKYSRTWTEPTSTGLVRQVWRFLVNGDAQFGLTGAGTAPVGPCPTPPCHLGAAGTPVHVVGHVDYACDPDPATATGFTYRAALSLTHWCGGVSHAFYGCRSLAPSDPMSHRERSYHLVAPAGFSFGVNSAGLPVQAPQGPILAEATRTSLLSPLGYLCLGESDVLQGSLSTQSVGCICGTPGPVRYEHQTFNGVVGCSGAASFWSNLQVPAGVPPGPTGFVAHPLGTWSNPPGTFPDSRQLTLYFGLVSFNVPCDTTAFPLHAVSGVATSHLGRVFGGPMPGSTANEFIDLQQCLKFGALLPGWGPGWGAPFISLLVWNLNMP